MKREFSGATLSVHLIRGGHQNVKTVLPTDANPSTYHDSAPYALNLVNSSMKLVIKIQNIKHLPTQNLNDLVSLHGITKETSAGKRTPTGRDSPSARLPSLPLWNPTSGAQRKIAIAVDLSDESAFAVKWAVQNYLRPGDAVILLHVRPTSVLYGADWGAIDLSVDTPDEKSQQKLEDDFDNFTSSKANDLAQPLVEANIPFKIHIVKDHDMKERLCLEVERLGLSAVIMGSRGFGASRRSSKGRLGSVSDYCVHHCVCPVVVVRFPDEKDGAVANVSRGSAKAVDKDTSGLHPVPEEEEPVFLDASDKNAEEEIGEVAWLLKFALVDFMEDGNSNCLAKDWYLLINHIKRKKIREDTYAWNPAQGFLLFISTIFYQANNGALGKGGLGDWRSFLVWKEVMGKGKGSMRVKKFTHRSNFGGVNEWIAVD
ncbi:UNVERIFIED_CONTAM: Universal stress protein PHOS32 [Sesamum calycinum]|uniref:Universal stress protein PHOS32 n=1 Tax=Sesamum calycinum TaxID=2727403 RepID=A0AAW2Q5X6_9LAMI